MNKKLIYSALGLLISCSVYAQKNPDAVKYSAAVNKDNAYKHLSVLASDEYEGRETGKKGAWMAADYIKAHFKKIGLVGPVKGGKDPYFQEIGYSSYALANSALNISGQAKTSMADFYITPTTVKKGGFNVKTNGILFAGYGIDNTGGYSDYAGQNVAGKVVMIFATGDPSAKPVVADPAQGRRRAPVVGPTAAKIAYLVQHQAAGIIIINPVLDNAARLTPQMKNMLAGGSPMLKTNARMKSMEESAIVPTIYVSSATANQILANANTTVEAAMASIKESMKPATIEVKVPVSFSAMSKEVPVRAENVLGFLEGSDPKLKHEVLVVTGHYDHIGLVQDPNAVDKVNNGADDDGSGTVGVMIIAEAFMNAKKAGKGPKRSILFMTVVGEEKGLLGSEWYSEHPVFPVENTITDLNTDMIGRVGEPYLGKPDSANYVYSVGSFMLSTDLGKLAEKVNNTYTNMILDYKFDDPKDTERIYYRSDHYNFAKLGIPVIFYYDGMLQQDYHRPGDEVSKINFDLLAKRAHLTYYLAWELANGAKRPVVDRNADGTPKTN